MPRVVPDQKTKFETDELFKKLSQDVDVRCYRSVGDKLANQSGYFAKDVATSFSSVFGVLFCACSVLVIRACTQVKFTGYKERPVEERKRKFLEDIHEGHSTVVSNWSVYSLTKVHDCGVLVNRLSIIGQV